LLSSAACREARLSWGGPSESRGEDEDEEDDEEDDDVEEELAGVISACGVPSLEPETARRNRGGAPSLLEEDELELFDAELFAELFDAELLELSSELELARRSLGRSGSLSLDELDEELLLELSSELDDDARRSVGLLPLELTEELPLELFDEEDDDDDDELSEDLGSGFMSSVCSDASECSSVVPSRTMEIVDAL
jgi:hypothetical protein